MLDAIFWYLVGVFPFYRAAQDAGMDMLTRDLQLISDSLKPPKD